MGGSILGTEAIHNFFSDKIKKDIYFFNNINEKKILNFKKKKFIKSSIYNSVKVGKYYRDIIKYVFVEYFKKKCKKYYYNN